MFCNQCGEEVPEDSKFCPFCGASIIKKPKKVPISEPTEKNESSDDNFMDEEVKKKLRDIGKNPKSIGKNPKFMGTDSKNHASPNPEVKRKPYFLIIVAAVLTLIFFIRVYAQIQDEKAYKQGVQQLENNQYDTAASTFFRTHTDKGQELYKLASSFRQFSKGDYEMADYYLKEISIKNIEEKYPDLKDSIDAMKTKLDDTREARDKASQEKYEAERKQKKEEERQRAQEYQSTLHIGDPDNKIVDVMGTPEAKNTTQVDGHQSVQWVYRNTYIYTDDGIISAIQKFE